MKKIKFIIVMVLLLLSIATMQSCIAVRTDLEINNDAGGKFTNIVEMQKSTYDMLVGEGSTNEDDLIKQLNNDDFKVEYFNKDDTEYVRFVREFDTKEDKVLCDTIKDAFQLSSLTVERADEKHGVTIKGEFDDLDTQDVVAFSSYILKIEMPNRIKSIKGCAVEGDNSKTFELDLLKIVLGEERSFEVYSEQLMPVAVFVLIVVFASLAVLGAGAIILIKILKKIKANALAKQAEQATEDLEVEDTEYIEDTEDVEDTEDTDVTDDAEYVTTTEETEENNDELT